MTDKEPQERSGPQAGAARLTPYEIAFGEGEFAGRVFPEIKQEADSREVDPSHRELFTFLSVVGDALRDVVPPDAPPDALEQYRALLFHAFNFWRFGKRLYLLEPAVVRYLIEAPPTLEGWEFTLPRRSAYLQFPPNLFWASIAADSTPEPVDGFFATASESIDAQGRPYQRLEVLLVLGIRRDRAGFSIIPFEAEVVPGIVAEWSGTPGREQGADFENILPGGDLAGFYSILTSAEALKLLARACWYIDNHPESLSLEEPPERRAEERSGSSPLSRLPFCRVTLDPRGGAEAHGSETAR